MIPTLFPPTVTTTLGWQSPSMSGVALVSILLEISRVSTAADIYCAHLTTQGTVWLRR